MKLYETSTSPFCHRVRIVLAEKELDFQHVQINLAERENKSEQFLRLNPLGKVPVLVDEGLILAESNVICQYLDEEYPYPALMPEDSQAKSLVRLWMTQIDAMVAQPWLQLWIADRAKQKGEEVDEAKVQSYKDQIQNFFVHAGRTLKSSDYLVKTFSLADIAFAPLVFKLDKMKITPPADLPQVAAWMKRLAARPSVQLIKA